MDLFSHRSNGFIFLVSINKMLKEQTTLYTRQKSMLSFVYLDGGWMEVGGSVRVNSNAPPGQGQMAKIERFVAFRCFPPTPLGTRLIEISTREVRR